MKALVTYKKSTYSFYNESPDEETKRFMESDSTEVEDMRESHEIHTRSLNTVLNALTSAGVHYERRYRSELTHNMDIDLIVSVGGDGTLLDVAHYINDIPIMGVNSDPRRSVGFYTCCHAVDFDGCLANIRHIPHHSLNRLELVLNGEPLPEQVLNDVLISHTDPSAGMRYSLRTDEGEMKLRGNGMLICATGGSTAWMWEEGGKIMPLDSDEIQYLIQGVRGQKSKFTSEMYVRSMTREGMLNIDGQHLKYPFGLGSELIVRKGTPATIISDLEAKRKSFVESSR